MFCGEDEDSELIGPNVLQHAPTKKHKGDFFTKDTLTADEFQNALTALRIHPNREEFERGERVNRAQNPPILPSQAAELLASTIQDSAAERGEQSSVTRDT